jgi:hypothetical protein
MRKPIFLCHVVCVMQYWSNGALIRNYVYCNVTRFLVSARRATPHSAFKTWAGDTRKTGLPSACGVIWNMLRKPNVREQEHCNNVFNRNVTKSVSLGVTWLTTSTAGIRKFNLRSQFRKTGKIDLNQCFIHTHPFLHSHPNFYLSPPPGTESTKSTN